MREAGLIAQREFRERISERGFWIGTFVLPALYACLFSFGPGASGGAAAVGAVRLVVVCADPQLSAGFAQALSWQHELDARAPSPRLETESRALAEARPELEARVRTGALDGWIELPADLPERRTMRYRARNDRALRAGPWLRRAAVDALALARLERAGVSGEILDSLRAPLALDAELADPGDAGRRASLLAAPFVIAMALYYFVWYSGSRILQSVVAEKRSRIPEVLLTSLRARDLLLGKIGGVCAVTGLQALLWVALLVGGSAVLNASGRTPGWSGIPAPLVSAPGLAVLLLYAGLGYLLYAALFAALGAAIANAQEGVPWTLALSGLLLLPILSLQTLEEQPFSAFSRLLGLLPFSSPVAMPVRLALAPVPSSEALASLLLLVAAAGLALWLAERIYRIGILSTGRRPSLSELVRWIRMQ